MPEPVAVLISDVHYSLPTLELADASMRQAVAKANELQVPLIVAGDLHDTKANLRGECVNAMLETFKLSKTECFIMIGNHDRINEKSESHSLNFLSQHCHIVNDHMGFIVDAEATIHIEMLPYSHDPSIIRNLLQTPIIRDGIIIMHQGIEGSNSGDYIQDKSAINPKDVAGLRVISGHYHTRQTMLLPDGGRWDYLGNPYTLNFGEANDPPKGFQILMSDGSLQFVPTNLRKHIVMNVETTGHTNYVTDAENNVKPGDLVWVKLKGPREYLSVNTKKELGMILSIFQDFKLTLEPTDLNIKAPTKTLTSSELLDSLIDSIDTIQETKDRLKTTWKSLCEF